MFLESMLQPDSEVDWISPVNMDFGPNRGIVSRYLTVAIGGNRWRDIAGSNHGTLINGPTWSGLRRNNSTGYLSGSLLFDGSNDYVSLPDLQSKFVDKATFSVWVRKRVHTPSDPTSGSWYLGGVNSDTQNSHYPYADGAIYDASFSTTRKDVGSGIITDRTRWHHVAITADGTANVWRFYQNGSLIFTTTVGTFLFPSAPKLGASIANRYMFDGSLDDACLWNRALSASEIKSVYDDGLAGYPRTLNWIQNFSAAALSSTSNRRRRLICAGG